MEGVASVEEAYMHVARYNNYYPQASFDMPEPEGIDLETIESIRGKEAVVAELRRSLDHVRDVVEGMTEEDHEFALRSDRGHPPR